MTDRRFSPAERELRLRIRSQLRRLQAGLDRDAALDAIMELIQGLDEAGQACSTHAKRTVH